MTFQTKQQIKDSRLNAHEIHTYKGVRFRRTPETPDQFGGYEVHPLRGTAKVYIKTKQELINRLDEIAEQQTH